MTDEKDDDKKAVNPDFDNVVQMKRNAVKAERPAASSSSSGSNEPPPRDTRPRAPEEGAEFGPDFGEDGGDGDRRPPGLPEKCPITPLGTNGDFCFYLDFRGAFRPVKDEKHTGWRISSLLGTETWWAWKNYPVYDKEGDNVIDWSSRKLGRDLLRAASALDVWKGLDRVRGPGCWRGEDGELIVHCGDELIVGGKTSRPGVQGRYVYPAGDRQPRPWHEPAPGGAMGPGHKLLDMVSTWAWTRPAIDPLLLVGWIGAAILGGALQWRPMICVTGEHGWGKTTLQELAQHVVGSLVKSGDASAAGLWNAIEYSSIPVMLDEFEADADDRKSKAIITLMRLAASGGIILRGTADHKAATFQARSCFWFSAINPPVMEAQDLSRLAMLELKPLPADAKPPELMPAQLREIGAKIRRRMIDNWERFPAVLTAYQNALRKEGHSGRGADQFGALLACAEIMLWDAEDFSADGVDALATALAAGTLAETADNERQHEQCLTYLLSSMLDGYRGGKQLTVAQHIRVAHRSVDNGDSKQLLANAGLRIVYKPDGGPWLAVANKSHRGTASLFAGSKWAGGGWERMFQRRLPGGRPSDSSVSIGGIVKRVSLIPLALIEAATAPFDEEGI